MKRLTASRLHIAADVDGTIRCAHFLRDDVPWHKETTTYTNVGNATHETSDQLVKGNLPDVAAIAAEFGMNAKEEASVQALVQRYADWFATQDTERWRSEVKLAWDPFDNKPVRLKSKLPRDYSELDGTLAVCGTADLAYPVSLDGDTVACIDDIKTGFGKGTDPVIQGGMLVMMLAALLKTDQGRFRVVRVEENDEVRPKVFDFSRGDLRNVKHTIGEVTRVALNDPEPREGPWCRYCPARVTCKATASAANGAMDLIPEASLTRKKHTFALRPTDDEHAAWTHAALGLVRSLLDKVEEGMRGYADEHGGIRLPDGTLFKGWEGSKRVLKIDDKALEVLKSFNLDTKAIEKKASIGGIQKAAGGKSLAEPVLQALVACGAISDVPTKTYETRKAR